MKRRQKKKKTERKCYIFLESRLRRFFPVNAASPTPPHPTSSYWMIICQCRCHHFLQFFLSALVLLSRQNHISWGIQSTMALIFLVGKVRKTCSARPASSSLPLRSTSSALFRSRTDGVLTSVYVRLSVCVSVWRSSCCFFPSFFCTVFLIKTKMRLI